MLVLGCLLTAGCDAAGPSPEPVFGNLLDEVHYLIESRFTSGGVAVGIIDHGVETTIFHGTKGGDSSAPPDEDTVYEMGSVTKAFTGTLLADAVLSETVGLHDAIQDHMPADSVSVPMYGDTDISLWHLVTHTSALPRNFSDAYPLPTGTPDDDPFALITGADIYNHLSNYVTLTRRPGTQYEYSNFGVGLLGFILGRTRGMTYASLLQMTILDVLGMDSTSVHLSEAQMGNLAVGHDDRGNEVAPWGSDHALVGCGGLKSTLKDMMIFLRANLGLVSTSLDETLSLAQQPQFSDYVCFCWFLKVLDDGQIITQHGGAAAGHITYIAFNRSTSTGVVILYNRSGNLLPLEVGDRILQAVEEYR
jgi:D-alanyl-D-alanine-carboxypeptidase/D-alanyl-D-alanine-endopeptidase